MVDVVVVGNAVDSVQDISDGYHTFSELYEHRLVLMAALMKCNPEISWRAHFHDDKTMFPDRFIVGMGLPSGQITYHCPVKNWDLFDIPGIRTLNFAPEWDGHSSREVVERIKSWVNG